ncbi:MAG: DUF1540 domain-containing protein [Firmicutes bacterium]|nr:DUF1540 domain-containing protein [Bacillota bacterium]
MKDLKCGLRDCQFNKGYCCVSKKIGVDNSTDCTTYKPNEDKRRQMFEGGEDFVPANYSVDTAVECTAHDCIFNKSTKCIANGITVMSSTSDKAAMCMTYIKH